MSWITATVVIVLASFVCSFILAEWIVARRRGPGDDDGASPAG